MEITLEQRRTLVALVCKMAWADGVVTDEERVLVTQLVARVGGDAVSADELDAWLASGEPDVTLERLPEGLTQFAIYEVMKIMESDGDVDDRELALVQSLVDRVYADEPKETPLAKIALKKKAVRA